MVVLCPNAELEGCQKGLKQMGAGIMYRVLSYLIGVIYKTRLVHKPLTTLFFLPPQCFRLQAVLDASGMGGKGGGKGDRAQGISQGVHTLDKAMVAAREFES